MTITVTVAMSATVTSIIQSTQTNIVQGILDVAVTQAQEPTLGITLGKKGAGPTTVSTIHVSSTSTTSSVPAHTGSLGSGSLFGTSTTGTKNSNAGLVIGIPVAVISVALIVVGVWVYIHRWKNKSKKSNNTFKRHYDEKFNYRMSPGEAHSPYNMRAIYQVKAKDLPADDLSNSQLNMSSQIKPQNLSKLSLKEPPTAPDSRWNLNTPLSRWFAKHSPVSEVCSRASVSTAPFSPIMALKEFRLGKNRSEINEKSPILPSFPETSYFPYGQAHYTSNYHSTSLSNKSMTSNDTVVKQEIQTESTQNVKVPKLKLKKKNKKGKKARYDKPLPSQPYFNGGTPLDGLEQRVYERVIPTTPAVDLSKPQNNTIYRVKTKYVKNLADELSINPGEYVKILARHTDGWCLVEKVDKAGKAVVVNHGYINEGRGVAPEMCMDI